MRVQAPHLPTSPAPTLKPITPAEFPKIDGVVHKFVMVNGIRYHYAEAGHGEPLILIHGFPENWYMWRDLIPGLAKHYRVIAPDMRGAGWTEAPRDGYGKEQLADELATFMDVVKAPRARVMGHDWGGYVGFMLALKHPDKVSQYVAMDVATPWPSAKSLTQAWKILYQPILANPLIGVGLLRQPLFVKSMLLGASTKHPWKQQDFDMLAAPYQDAAHARAGSSLYRTFLNHEAIPWLLGKYNNMRLEPQTLFLAGANDAVVKPALIDGFAKHSRDMRAEFIPGAGHFLPEEAPGAVVERALKFFGATKDAPPPTIR